MEKDQSLGVKAIFSWEARGYEEYIAGYKLYKQLKKKWDAVESKKTSVTSQKMLV
ncbi:hypothetical protein [Metaplanococcus flavidus]|uniref:Uncharacterized protein n=1 Tax=Metaplanococcus flavidus TaxID=569883 RepID=A0ABW3LA66_9BACL